MMLSLSTINQPDTTVEHLAGVSLGILSMAAHVPFLELTDDEQQEVSLSIRYATDSLRSIYRAAEKLHTE